MNAVPIIRVDAGRAEAAWEAHRALLDAERREPALRDNPVWKCLRMDAYEQFCLAFGKAA